MFMHSATSQVKLDSLRERARDPNWIMDQVVSPGSTDPVPDILQFVPKLTVRVIPVNWQVINKIDTRA